MKPLVLLTITALASFSNAQSIDHVFGQTTLESPAERVVTLYQGATDAAIALGVEPVGIVESWVEKPVYQYLRAAASNIAQVGLETQPNLEEIAALQPDVIIASKLRHEKVYPQLAQIAPTVALETVFEFKETLDLVAAVTGKEAEAAVWHQQWNDRIQAFHVAMESQQDIAWPQKVALLNFRSDHARIYYSSFAGNILNHCCPTVGEIKRA